MPEIDLSPAATNEGGAPEDPEPPPSLELDVVLEAGDWDHIGDMAVVVGPIVNAVASHPALRDLMPANACLALADDRVMRRLNSQFRAQDRSTNVLSFPAALGPPSATGAAGTRFLGDIVLGLETILDEASHQALTPHDHIRHLVLHGLLHLMGFDHGTDAEAAVMEALEIEILAGLGIANPYSEAAAAPFDR